MVGWNTVVAKSLLFANESGTRSKEKLRTVSLDTPTKIELGRLKNAVTQKSIARNYMTALQVLASSMVLVWRVCLIVMSATRYGIEHAAPI